MRRWNRLPRLVALVTLAVLPFLPSVRGPFLFDDQKILFSNQALRDPGNLTELFLPSEWVRLHQATFSPYRPLRETALGVIALATNWNPLAFRVVNLVLNVTAALAFLVLARRTIGGGAAWWAAALFAVHPIHVESVCWIKNVAELAAFALALAAMGLHFHGARRADRWLDGWSLGASAAFAAAVLFKESAVFVPAALLAAAWGRVGSGNRGNAARRTLPLWVVATVYAIVQVTVMSQKPGGGIGQSEPAFPAHLALVVRTVAGYCRLMLFPTDLCVWHPFPIPVRFDGSAAIAAMGLMCLGLAIFAVWRRSRTAGWWLLLSLVALAPASNLTANLDRPLAEQRAYSASAGICVALGWALARLGTRRTRAAMLLGAVLLACFVGRSLVRSRVWSGERPLWLATVRHTPRNYRVRMNLASTYWNLVRSRGQAEREYLAAMALAPDDDTLARDNYISFLIQTGRLKTAEELLFRAPRIGDDAARRQYLVGLLHEKRRRLQEALDAYTRSLELQPDNAEAWYNRGNVREKLRMYGESEADFRTALACDPRHASAAVNLGFVCLRRGELGAARRCFERALRSDPVLAHAAAGLGQALLRLGHPREAIDPLRRALAARPDWGMLQEELAKAYEAAGFPEKARAVRERRGSAR